MIPVALVKPLGRYADVLNLVSLFPLLSYLKFGYLLRDRERRARAARRASREGQEAEEDERVTEEKANWIPSATSLILLLFAELCTSWQLLDPSDKLVRRAVGEVGRMKKKTKPGLSSVHDAILKLLESDDFYELIRFISTFSCLTGIVITVGLRLHDSHSLETGNPFKHFLKTFGKTLHILWSPRLWLAALLCVAFTVGNWSLLAKFIRRPIAAELLRAFARLARALSAALVATGSSYEGELPFWCAMQGIAAVARATHLIGYERASWTMLLEVSKRSVLGGLVMEVLCFLQMLPCALRRRRLLLTIALFVAPCAAALSGGPALELLQPIVAAPEMMHRLALAILAIGTMSLFLGGFSGMISAVLLLQALNAIHGLDKLKY